MSIRLLFAPDGANLGVSTGCSELLTANLAAILIYPRAALGLYETWACIVTTFGCQGSAAAQLYEVSGYGSRKVEAPMVRRNEKHADFPNAQQGIIGKYTISSEPKVSKA